MKQVFYKLVSDLDLLGRSYSTREEAREAKRKYVAKGFKGYKIHKVTVEEVR